MAESPPLLELRAITKEYTIHAEGEPLKVLDDVHLQIGSGESLAVIGPSGSGKTTLLNMMGGLDRPTSGRILLLGKDLMELQEKDLDEIRNRWIGFVFQSHHLLPQCTVLENVLIPTLADGSKRTTREAEARARQLLERTGLENRSHYLPGLLSGGERQRVAVVRALINSPKLLLADEPTGSLDHRTALEILNLLLELNREHNTALVVVTHSLELAHLLGRKVELREGSLREASPGV
jgi:ABC-type lipoprotein export system ATPase subunit